MSVTDCGPFSGYYENIIQKRLEEEMMKIFTASCVKYKPIKRTAEKAAEIQARWDARKEKRALNAAIKQVEQQEEKKGGRL